MPGTPTSANQASRPRHAAGASATTWALLAIILLGALLRVPGLERESFWVDEAIATNAGTRPSIFDAVRFEAAIEVNPPLYHIILWMWINLLSANEGTVRLLSSLAGIATIPVTYGIGRRLHSPRVGLLAGLLAATSPMLVHYSQEARPYALFTLLGALSLLLLLRVLDEPTRRNLTLWALASLAALATSYFGAFLVAVEAAWLLRVRRHALRAVLPAVGAVGVGGLALLPLALYQRRPGGPGIEYISSVPLRDRLQEVSAEFIKGVGSARATGLGLLATGLVIGGAVLLVRRSEPSERRTVALPLAVGLGGIGLVVAFDLIAFPIVLYRYLLAFWLPLAVVLAIGLGSRRAGRVGVTVGLALASVWIAINLETFGDDAYHRDNWRAALAPLGPTAQPRIIVVSPGYAYQVLFYYRRVGRPLPPAGARVREIALVYVRDPPTRLPRASAFNLVEKKRYPTLMRVRYRAPQTAIVKRQQVLPPGGSGDAAPVALVQAPSR